ncbi:MAG: polymer-forming cytoskeletal protein [Pseudomonadota bacterium]
MFRKRDSDPLQNEGEPAQDSKIGLKPQPEAEPDLQLRPEEPEPAIAPPEDNPPSELDLPESEPLSAAQKTAAANVSPAASSSPEANKRLIVGQGIRLSGEINSCDRLVVEGEVEVTLNDTLALEITSSGRFTGGCEVEEADISGIYEGDLTVRNTLFVRGTGRITGTIRYGQLELERGGQIAGNISVLGNDNMGAGSGDAGKVRSAKAPLFGGGND